MTPPRVWLAFGLLALGGVVTVWGALTGLPFGGLGIVLAFYGGILLGREQATDEHKRGRR